MDIVSDAMVLPPDNTPVSQLSGGERRRVALSMALLEKPDLLLLDEPTNHLDAETVQWLEVALRDYPGTVIIATHDRYFLDNITKWILELDKSRGIPFEGNYSSWLKQKLDILRLADKKESPRQKTLTRELEWISASTRDRNQKNQARINAYGELTSISAEDRNSDVLIQIPTGPRLGDKVLAFKDVCKGYGDNQLLDRCSSARPPCSR
jgi:ATPase subunit of ABC transporter with duplicated ATPase domains